MSMIGIGDVGSAQFDRGELGEILTE